MEFNNLIPKNNTNLLMNNIDGSKSSRNLTKKIGINYSIPKQSRSLSFKKRCNKINVNYSKHKKNSTFKPKQIGNEGSPSKITIKLLSAKNKAEQIEINNSKTSELLLKFDKIDMNGLILRKNSTSLSLNCIPEQIKFNPFISSKKPSKINKIDKINFEKAQKIEPQLKVIQQPSKMCLNNAKKVKKNQQRKLEKIQNLLNLSLLSDDLNEKSNKNDIENDKEEEVSLSQINLNKE